MCLDKRVPSPATPERDSDGDEVERLRRDVPGLREEVAMRKSVVQP